MADSQDQGKATGETTGTPGVTGDGGKEAVIPITTTSASVAAEYVKGTPSGTKGHITQEDLNKAAGSARQEGKDVALSDFARELGVASPDELKSLVKAHKEAEESRMGELEKLQTRHDNLAKDRDKLKAARDDLQGQIKALHRSQALQSALMEAGVNSERVDAVSRLVDADALEVTDDGKVTGLEEAIASAKELAPELFKQPTRSVGSGSNPPVDPPDAKDDFSTMDRAQFDDIRRRALMGEKIRFS